MHVCTCPSCGAPVEFHSVASVMAVCGFCRTTLVRRDEEIENLGVMAELAEDRSPFRLKYRGSFHKIGYELIGRLQLQYEDGYWNEWYARFDDGRLGWLSEGSGLCYITFEQALKQAIPAYETFKLGQTLNIGKEAYTVSDIENASCVAIEGELPFRASPGYQAPSIDLRSTHHFASIDYSETPPKLYLGEAVQLNEVIDKADDTPRTAKHLQARIFKCTNCGAPMSVRSGEILAVGCAHCGAVIDPHSPSLAVLSKAIRAVEEPFLVLGSKGTLAGNEYTIIGYLNRKTEADGTTYYWNEFLLHSEKVGYAWLSEYDGHWSLGHAISTNPTVTHEERPTVKYGSETYRHFDRYTAVTDQVLGEFTWRVKVGETVEADDFIAPPYLLSREQSHKEITWTKSVYVPREEIEKAFKSNYPLPAQQGVGVNQEAPDCVSYWVAFIGLAIVAALLQFFFMVRADKQILWTGDIHIDAGINKQSLTSTPIHIASAVHNIRVQQNADVSNNWVDTSLLLTNTQTGEQFNLERELSFYSGQDSDGHWEEGSQKDNAYFTNLPAGDYILGVDAEAEDKPDRPAINTHIVLQGESALWGNFWVLLFTLGLGPLITTIRTASFETRRWANSEYGKP